jgi:predicted secreted protein
VPLTTSLAIYFIIWWLVFFAVLPWGIRSQQEHGGDIAPGTDPGAPAVHGLKVKLVWTTAVATILFAAFYWAYVTKAIAFDDLVTLWGLLKP